MKTLQSRTIAVATLLLSIFSSCGNKEIKQTDSSTPGKEQTVATKTPVINFRDPIYIDSTDYVMYPLSTKKDNSDGSYNKILSGTGIPTYWNIAFYNMVSKTYHLLDDKRKMLITSYAQEGSFQYSSAGIINTNKSDDIIFYSVVVTDYNKDGKLDPDDPSYLFISDKKGNNFKQISPEGLKVTGWKTIKRTGKVLIQAVGDTNNDKKFDNDDEALPYVYDIKTGAIAQPVFGKDFTDAADQVLEKHWK
ncbi:MAG: hypothetical protein H7289_15800 [Mucilaginibacter sp.]|nr:hypothetical protein [Mucilaginibacter sp.]